MISAENLGFAYQKGRWVLRNVSFTVEAGEVLGILGPNGRGKTTLLRLLMGLLSPQEGRFTTDDRPGYVPQVGGFPFPYDALEIVVMGRSRLLKFFQSPRAEDYRRAREAMAMLGLSDLERVPYSRLSGGQQQMVLIARALASGARSVILDEPASALDFKNQQRALSVLSSLAKAGITVLFTSHSPQHVLSFAHKALLMYGPGLIKWGTVDAVMSEENLQELYGIRVRRLDFWDDDGRPTQALVPFFYPDASFKGEC